MRDVRHEYIYTNITFTFSLKYTYTQARVLSTHIECEFVNMQERSYVLHALM